MRDGTGDGVGTRKVKCQGYAQAAARYLRFTAACVFSLQVYSGGACARYIFKWFLRLAVLIWRKVFVIYRFGPLWLPRCVSGEGLVRSRWLAPVRGF